MVIYFWVISKDWFYVILIGYVLQIVGAVLAWTLPEAPPYLFSVHRYEDAFGVFQKMKNYNKAPYSPVWDQLQPSDLVEEKTGDAAAVVVAVPTTMDFLR